VKAERFDRNFVWRGDAIFAVDHSEASRVVPHGPADIVFFKRAANIAQPCGAIICVRCAAVYAKLVTSNWNIPPLAPRGDFSDFRVNTRGIPLIETITYNGLSIDCVGHLRSGDLYVFWS